MSDADDDGASRFRRLLEGLPQQAREAWALGRDWPLPPSLHRPSRVVLAGLGGSAIGADVVATLARLRSGVAVEVIRDYTVPRLDADGLLVACSLSGETEETLAAFEAAAAGPGMRLALTTGGRLAAAADAAGAPLIRYTWDGPPRTGFGYGVFTLLAVLTRLEALALEASEIERALTTLEEATTCYAAVTPNLAGNVAEALGTRIPVIVGADCLEVAARRFATEVNENAKQWAFAAALPEFDHNALQALAAPEGAPDTIATLILDAPAVHPRNRLRVRETAAAIERAGGHVRVIDAGGDTPFDAILRACTLGSWVSYYLARQRGVDPLAVPLIEAFKRRMATDGS